MLNIRETPFRKTVMKGGKPYKAIIVTDNYYKTNGESVIVVKDITESTIELDSTTTDRIKIKTLTNCTLIPDVGQIDEDWDEISVGRGACVELQYIGGTWYILSSDGLKME
jgi:hypothetical protein